MFKKSLKANLGKARIYPIGSIIPMIPIPPMKMGLMAITGIMGRLATKLVWRPWLASGKSP